MLGQSFAHLTKNETVSDVLMALVKEPTQSSRNIASFKVSESCIGISEAMLADHNTQMWYANGGPSKHMSDCRENFMDMREVPNGTWYVLIANDQRLWVRGVGKIHIERWIDEQWHLGYLQEVLYVPKLQTNLYSIGAAADRGVVTIYEKDGCTLIDEDGWGQKSLRGYHSSKL